MNRQARPSSDAPHGPGTSWGDVSGADAAPSRRRADRAEDGRPARSRFGLGVLAGLAVMAVAAVGYGVLLRATMSGDGGYHEFAFAALVVGLLVGAATGLAGGRNAALPVAGLLLAVLGVCLGEIVGVALISSHRNGVPIADVAVRHYATLLGDWRRQLDVMSCVFALLAGVTGLVVTRRVGGRRRR